LILKLAVLNGIKPEPKCNAWFGSRNNIKELFIEYKQLFADFKTIDDLNLLKHCCQVFFLSMSRFIRTKIITG
jgi:DNA-directed RNA polymerase subunit N (RpoN/RPB10)